MMTSLYLYKFYEKILADMSYIEMPGWKQLIKASCMLQRSALNQKFMTLMLLLGHNLGKKQWIFL